MRHVLMLPLSMIALVAAIYVVRQIDRSTADEVHEVMECPRDHVLVQDSTQNFYCLHGSLPFREKK